MRFTLCRRYTVYPEDGGSTFLRNAVNFLYNIKRCKYQVTAISQRGEYLTPPKFHIVVYWAVKPHSLAGDDHRFGEIHRVVW